MLAGEEGEPRRRNRGSQRNQANTSMAFAAAVKPLKRRWKRGKGRGLMGGGGWGRRVEEEGCARRMGKGLAGERSCQREPTDAGSLAHRRETGDKVVVVVEGEECAPTGGRGWGRRVEGEGLAGRRSCQREQVGSGA